MAGILPTRNPRVGMKLESLVSCILKHAGYFAGSIELFGLQSSVRKGEAGRPFLL